MEGKRIEVRIVGEAPLLMNRFTEEAQEEMEHTAKRKSGKEKVDPKEAAKTCLYTLPDGKLCQPSEHIFRMMVKSAANFQITGRGKKTYKDLVLGALDVTPELIPHKQQKWEVDSRPVTNVHTRGRKMKHRPRLNAWELSFDFTTRDDQLSPSTLREILEYGGQCVGIGDYRPRFGRFRVTYYHVED